MPHPGGAIRMARQRSTRDSGRLLTADLGPNLEPANKFQNGTWAREYLPSQRLNVSKFLVIMNVHRELYANNFSCFIIMFMVFLYLSGHLGERFRKVEPVQ